MELLPQEVEEWLQNPVTLRLMLVLRQRQMDLQDRWAEGAYLSENPYVSQGLNAKAIGAFEVYDDLLNNLSEVLSDGN